MMIQSNCRDWDDAQNHGWDAGGDHPGREWAGDESLHSGPTGKKGIGPEPDCRQMIAINRSTDHFRDHVISGAEGERTEPKEKKIVRVPPINCGLHNALHRPNKNTGLRT